MSDASHTPKIFGDDVYREYFGGASFDDLVDLACFVGVPFLMVCYTKYVQAVTEKYPELSTENAEHIHKVITLSRNVLDAAEGKDLIRTDDGLIKYITEEGQQLIDWVQVQLQMMQKYNLSPDDWRVMCSAPLEMEKRFRSKKNRDNASGGRKAEWALMLAYDLSNRFDSFSEAWEAIEEDGLKTYRGADKQGRERVYHSSRSEGDKTLTRESFRTKYWIPANK